MGTSTERVFGIVVAAGSGERLGAAVPKALVSVAGRTILARAITRLLGGATRFDGVVVTFPSGYRKEFEGVLRENDWGCQLVEGGETRQASVRRALEHLTRSYEPVPSDRILIHDAARCLVRPELVDSVIEATKETGAATLGTPVTDTLQRADERGLRIREPVSRQHLWRMQTPQVFEYRHIIRAHEDVSQVATDDATLVASFCPVTLVRGDETNLKITVPLDLQLLEMLEITASEI